MILAKFMAGRRSGIGMGLLIALMFGMLSFLFIVTGEALTGIMFGVVALLWIGITLFIKMRSPNLPNSELD